MSIFLNSSWIETFVNNAKVTSSVTNECIFLVGQFRFVRALYFIYHCLCVGRDGKVGSWARRDTCELESGRDWAGARYKSSVLANYIKCT